MLKSKESLVQYLGEQCNKLVLDNDICKGIYAYANEMYNIPKGMVSDLITKRMEMSDASEFILFALFDSIYNVCKNDGKKDIQGVDAYYTMKEAKHYRVSKYEVEKIKFPLVFKMVEVDNNQWIGKTDVQTLMLLRNAQLISYNVNTQRTLQKIVKGDKETYKISLNNKAVGEIKQSFEEGNFISNTITLNIPLDSDSDFYYDSDGSSLIIKSLDSFDILDGYHRFVAMGQIYDINNNFNCPMELRLTAWDETKAKTFIWQDNKKTFMKKVDRESYNLNKAANIVVERLNNNVFCNLKGMISRGTGIVNFGELADLVDYFYFKGISKEKERSVIIQAAKEITDNFNLLTEYDTDYLENKMSYRTLLTAMFCFNYFKDSKDKTTMCEVIKKASKAIENSDNKKFANKTPRKNLMTEVEEFVKGVM